MRFRKEKTDDKIICLESLVIKKNKKKTHCLRYSIRVFKSNFNKCILSWNSPNLTPPTATTICTSAVHTLPEPGWAPWPSHLWLAHLVFVSPLSAETLLDDFLLTYTVFMTTDDLCQALLRQYPSLASGCRVGFLPDRCLTLGTNCLSSFTQALSRVWLC